MAQAQGYQYYPNQPGAAELPPITQEELVCATLMAYGEDRRHGRVGMRATLMALRNRSEQSRPKWGGMNLCDLARKRGQFNGYWKALNDTSEWDMLQLAWEVTYAVFSYQEQAVVPSDCGTYFVHPPDASPGGLRPFLKFVYLGNAGGHEYYAEPDDEYAALCLSQLSQAPIYSSVR